MNKTIKKKLRQIIKDIRPYQPEKVILFGSYAKGRARKDSDIDLLIVKKTKKRRPERMDEVFDLLYKPEYLGKGFFNIPIEPHVYTPEELEQRVSLGDFFIKEILEQGKVIYEK